MARRDHSLAMTDVFLPMNGAARLTPVEPDLQLPGEPVPGLPRPGEAASPFSA